MKPSGKKPGTTSRSALGRDGEDRAARFLSEKGMKIISRNFRASPGEIDIIALDGEILVFIEVKAWTNPPFSELEYSLNRKKQKRIIETAKYFLLSHREYNSMGVRFDVLFVDILDIKHLESAFLE